MFLYLLFFGIVAENNSSPANGRLNCLKDEYEGDHDGSDGHPNEQAKLIAGEAVANFMIQLFFDQEFTGFFPVKEKVVELTFATKSNSIFIYSDILSDYTISSISLDGSYCLRKQLIGAENQINISSLTYGFLLLILLHPKARNIA